MTTGRRPRGPRVGNEVKARWRRLVARHRCCKPSRAPAVPAVLTNAVRYLDPVDSLTAQVLDAARHLVPLGSPRLVTHNGRAYLASQEDMMAVANRVAAAMSGPGTASAATLLLGETEELTRRCVLDPARDLGVGSRHLPETKGTAYDQYKELKERCEQAILHGRYRTASAPSRPRGVSRLRAAENARERLEHELDIIAQTGMAAYFLTVADVADRIRHAGIRCAIRGSGAGSFVNHLLGISAIDPLEHGLLMERFLSPIRSTLPDIDLDVESARRLDAYRIIFDRYGKERTACVCMMETYRARSAIRDVAAAMSLPPDEIGAIAKAFPHIRAKHITAALTELPELRRSRLNGAQLDHIQHRPAARRPAAARRHAPVRRAAVRQDPAQPHRRPGQRRGLPAQPARQGRRGDRRGDQAGRARRPHAVRDGAHAHRDRAAPTASSIDIDAMPRDDPATYAMIGRSETIGCFQIESPGQRELVKKLAPRDIADLIVDISLFRPGPVNSDMIGPFLRTRHGLAEPRYPHEKLAKALQETGGVVVFHEQVLRIIDEMTGCGLAEADLVRRHLSTEGGPERTAPWFRAQALARGFDPATVERVWQVVAAFGGFGFCKAHAAAFAIPVYQSAWLRRHHPAAFYAGVLTHDPGMYPKRVIIADARLSGVQVLPVDVNASAADWTSSQPPKILPTGDGDAGLLPPAAPAPGLPAARLPPPAAPDPPARSGRSASQAATPPRRPPGDPLLPPRGQGHQRRRDHPHRRRPALHQPARLLDPRRRLPPGRRAPGPHRRLRLPLRSRPPPRRHAAPDLPGRRPDPASPAPATAAQSPPASSSAVTRRLPPPAPAPSHPPGGTCWRGWACSPASPRPGPGPPRP